VSDLQRPTCQRYIVEKGDHCGGWWNTEKCAYAKGTQLIVFGGCVEVAIQKGELFREGVGESGLDASHECHAGRGERDEEERMQGDRHLIE
jgi:hypothetical protein